MDVFIKSGEQPRAFAFGPQQAFVTSITTNQNSLPLYKESVFSAFQAYMRGTGVIGATITILGSNHDPSGRGIVIPGDTSSVGSAATISNGSPTLTAIRCNYPATLVGMEVRGVGIPVGTTITAVAAGGATATMSANATATAMIETIFYDLMWCSTVMATITLSGTDRVSDGFTTQAPWRYVQARVAGITGTVTELGVNMGV